MSQPLLQPFKENGLELSNRIVMAPMTRSRADNPEKAPTADLQGEYYQQRATAGLIITEGSQISERGVGYINTPGIHSQAQIDGWKQVTEMVHQQNGKIFLQLWHVGRMSHPDFHKGELPLAPSAINPEAKSYTPDGFKDTVTPKAMSIEEIKQTIADFKQAAINAKEAGFDGVEIHSSNGYLLHQFFSATTNIRTDDYGGSIPNRARILFEILDEIKLELPDFPVGARFNPSLHGQFGMTLDQESIPTFEYILDKLNDYDLAYVHLSEPFTDVSDHEFAVTEVAKHFRPIYKGTLMINAGFNQFTGNKIIEDGFADLVAFGKPFISNPDLVYRYENYLELNEWDEDTFYTPGKKGYTDYPLAQETVNS
ncbi:alkene reductase [Gilvibacter sediminis]|uniref:alkene reductase n=1 Tax=Gilvibacter sediminis TaxID=379071 RepID=UPI0023502B93|nr:alkene reductase [Gilvibacter sediminis]MDC7998303.1 alkene reductase [Gilvibacter sediminis]